MPDKSKTNDNAPFEAQGKETLSALRLAEFGLGRSKARPYGDEASALRLGFVLVEPAGYVQHFGDVVAGTAADAVRLFRNADEHGFDIEKFEGRVKLLGFGNGRAEVLFAGHYQRWR